ncbi:MAG TPA: zinc-binding dehydrogenase [Nitrospiria bacterium]|jgi:NADPH:quinone reductase-like Zn-dependent oxidoreductase|nr:zinc-binding dehydrogenase [Nitrospiria bacterium]
MSLLFDFLDRQKIKPMIAGRIPLIEAARAHALLERGEGAGKLVLICNA